MTVYADGAQVSRAYWNGTPLKGIYVDGAPAWLATGLPTAPERFECVPAQATITPGGVDVSVALRNTQTGITAGSLVETLADGTRTVITSDHTQLTTTGPNSVSFRQDERMQSATYTLTLTNTSGTSVFTTRFTYGRAPTIEGFTATQFHQGILGLTPDSILLSWNVTDAVPAADVAITTDNPAGFHYHPLKTQVGTYRYSRQGTHTPETFTLTASNVFGSTTATAVVRWP